MVVRVMPAAPIRHKLQLQITKNYKNYITTPAIQQVSAGRRLRSARQTRKLLKKQAKTGAKRLIIFKPNTSKPRTESEALRGLSFCFGVLEVDKHFFLLNEVQDIGLPAARTLRNRLDARTGLLQIGGDAPPIRTILLGGARVITKSELERWLLAFESTSGGATQSDTPVVQLQLRRRGRPRQGGAI
jgi:hypothetical protein